MKHQHWTDQDIVRVCKTAFSKSDMIRLLGHPSKCAQGYYSRLLREDLARMSMDTSHFRRKPSEENRKYADTFTYKEGDFGVDRATIKKRMIAAGVPAHCSECGIENWQNKKLVLHLDHINGVNNDNRFDNLRLLCPNCHSQTPTYCGGNTSKARSAAIIRQIPRNQRFPCTRCSNLKSTKSPLCIECSNMQKVGLNTKTVWPSKEEMAALVWSIPTSKLAIQLGVSDSAIGKFCRKRNISKPPRGYWEKRQQDKATQAQDAK
jgi:hypothetical protein